ncbi:MAG: eL32 family ribosomal protein [Candidatus Pacearchaeota archaeon]|jgi:large subunit ribosomal protein L32e
MAEKKKPNFLRRSVDKYSKLGKGRKKKQKWKRPTGRDNKMREKRRGYPAVVSVGYKNKEKARGQIKDMKPVIVNNLKNLEKIGKNNIAIIGKVGNKKKMEIIKEAEKKKIEIANVNAKKFTKKIERKKMLKQKNKEDKKKIETKKEKKEKAKEEKKKSKEESKENKEVKEGKK